MGIFLLAGHTPKGVNQDPGAVGNGYREADLTMEFRDKVADILRAAGEKVYEDDDTLRLAAVLADVKSTEKDVVVDIHFNAGVEAATGVEVLVPTRSTQFERSMARRVCTEFAATMQIKDRGMKLESDSARKVLAVFREAGINILIEVCFISNKNDVAAYQKQKNVLATKLASIIQEYEKVLV